MAAARMVLGDGLWDGATMAADKMRAGEGLRLRVGEACAGDRLRAGVAWAHSVGRTFLCWSTKANAQQRALSICGLCINRLFI